MFFSKEYEVWESHRLLKMIPIGSKMELQDVKDEAVEKFSKAICLILPKQQPRTTLCLNTRVILLTCKHL